MAPPESRPFLIDADSGAIIRYGELRAMLGEAVVSVDAVAGPGGTSATLVSLAKALVLGRSLALVDTPGEASGGTGERAGAVSVPGQRFASVAEMIAAARGRSEARLTLHTSGSTGIPKRVTHGLESLGRMLRVSERHADDVWAFAYSPTHIAGVEVFLQAFFNANTMVDIFRLGRGPALEGIRHYRVTHISATPTFFRMLLPVGQPVESIRSLTLGGEPVESGMIGALQEAFPAARIRNVYASTEAGSLLVAEGDAFMIPEEIASRVRVGAGQIEVHRSLLGAFERNGEAVPEDGEWYQTGDVVEVVGEAPLRFRIVSRDRDWVNVGGNKVNPVVVEAELRRYPGVREARVSGRRSSVVGSILEAELVAEPRPVEAELRRFLAARLRSHEVPRMFRFVASIERTRTGKLQRNPLEPVSGVKPDPRGRAKVES